MLPCTAAIHLPAKAAKIRSLNLFLCRTNQVMYFIRVASMSGSQDGNTKRTRSTPGYIATIGAIGTALAIVNIMSNGSEAQSQPVLILEYAALALGVFALVGGLIMKLAQN